MFTIGVFQDAGWAERGIDALIADGFTAESLSVLAKATPEIRALIQARLDTPGRELELRGLGQIVAEGPLIDLLQGPDEALRSAHLAATFTRAGFQAHDGYIFETLVGRGGVLVGIRSEPRAADALAILHAYGGGNAAIGAWSGRV